MKKLLLIFSIVSIVVSCQVLAQQQDHVDNTFLVPLEKSITKAGVTIILAAVVEDSRCPRNITCMWEGKAVVELYVREPGQESQKMTVVFQNQSQSIIARTQHTVFTALRLLPYPGDSGNNTAYQLEVATTKNY